MYCDVSIFKDLLGTGVLRKNVPSCVVIWHLMCCVLLDEIQAL